MGATPGITELTLGGGLDGVSLATDDCEEVWTSRSEALATPIRARRKESLGDGGKALTQVRIGIDDLVAFAHGLEHPSGSKYSCALIARQWSRLGCADPVHAEELARRAVDRSDHG